LGEAFVPSLIAIVCVRLAVTKAWSEVPGFIAGTFQKVEECSIHSLEGARLRHIGVRKAKETTMEHGDHVKVIGRDGVYVFLKDVQGVATLRRGGKNLDEATIPVPIDTVISLEQENVTCPHPCGY
jgi:hypothetical protein